MKKYRLNYLILAATLLLTTSGCSLLKTIAAPLTPVKTTLPQSKKQSTVKYQCKAGLELFETGRVKSCTKGFKSYDKKFNEVERKLTAQEKVGQFISRMSGYLFIVGGLSLFFIPGIFGVIGGRIIEALFGIRHQAVKAFSRGIAKGKKYVKNNGTNLSPSEKKAYHQGAQDLLSAIAEETKDPKIKKYIYKTRGELKSKE